MTDLWTQTLDLHHPQLPGRAHLTVVRFDRTEVPEPSGWLGPAERDYAATLVHPRRRASWLSGRWAAKQALVGWVGTGVPTDFSVLTGIFGQPVVTGPVPGLQVTLAHAEGWAAALAFPETHPSGLDLELVGPRMGDTLRAVLAPGEEKAWTRVGYTEDQAYTLLWSAKEAVGKAVRTGITVPLGHLAAGPPVSRGSGVETILPGFPQYRVQAGLAGPFALALALPQMCRVEVDFQALQTWLSAV